MKVPQVNPDILRWARETAGYTPEEAVTKLNLNPARGVSATDRLEALETGRDFPTRPLLVRMAKQYRRPLLTFYLAEPPRRGDRGSDFRTLPSIAHRTDEAVLDALIRDLHARQSIVREALDDEDDAPRVRFVGSKTLADGIKSVLEVLRTTLRIDLDGFRSQRSPEDAFRLLRAAAEQAGVFVLLIGDLGSHHTSLDLETFRGFALADDIAPFVVINDRDSRAAWSFTLLHEFTHLCLGQTGVSGAYSDLAVERFCNEVAGEFLLPTDELMRAPAGYWSDAATLARRISDYASERNLSSTMVAYKLLRLRFIDDARYRQTSAAFRARWLESSSRRREAAREREGGPSYYVVRMHRVGNALLDVVARLVRTQTLTTSKAGKVLGVKAKQVQGMLESRGFGSQRQPS